MKNNSSKSAVAIPTVLPATSKPQHNLGALEKIIEENLAGSFKLAQAISLIRDQQLYKPEYKTFEEYCKKRWEYSRSYCTRLCEMNDVMQDLETYQEYEVYPKNEGQARIFVDLEKADRLKLAETVLKESKDDNLTAQVFAKFKKQLFPQKYEAKTGKPTPVIDVEEIKETSSDLLTKVYESAHKLYQILVKDEAECEVVDLLKQFIDSAKPLVEQKTGGQN